MASTSNATQRCAPNQILTDFIFMVAFSYIGKRRSAKLFNSQQCLISRSGFWRNLIRKKPIYTGCNMNRTNAIKSALNFRKTIFVKQIIVKQAVPKYEQN